MADNIPEGEFYSTLYVKPGAPLDDSDRFRRRIAAYFLRNLYYYDSEFSNAIGAKIEIETGADYFSSPPGSRDFEKFFLDAPIVDIFTAISIIWRILESYDDESADDESALHWRQFIERTFKEENLSYRVDSKCGIHPAVDQEFERNRVSSLAVLSEPRYAAVLHAAEAAFKQLDALPMDGKGAARNIFEAAESMTKILTGSGSNLDEGFVNKELRRIVDKVFAGDEQLKITANRLLSGFGKWVDAVHPFRHGHDREQPLVLPEDVAVLAVSQGASFLRWLADLDRRQR
jgi:hypothetical protein